MLILQIKELESVTIYANGEKITVQLVEIKNKRQVKIGFEAPKHVNIVRDELLKREVVKS